MYGFGTLTFKDRREANSLIYQAKPTNRAGTESSSVAASWDMRVL